MKIFSISLKRGTSRCTPAMTSFILVIILVAVIAAALPVAAQQTQTITDDQVNAVAGKLYCPVCENIPLDVCPTLACEQWREEIRTQLASGMTDQQVIDNFVQRYGERVVGTPQDPTLRALSLITPWILGFIAALFAAFILFRWRTGRSSQPAPVGDAADATGNDEDSYRNRIEQDLLQRR